MVYSSEQYPWTYKVKSFTVSWYGRDNNKNLIIIEEEAKIVRPIYDLFLKGYGCRKIK